MIPSTVEIRSLVSLISLCAITSCISTSSLKPQLLNSERIRQTFGSYGIQVLYQDPNWRFSALSSLETTNRVCRTFAVVKFKLPIPKMLHSEHQAILQGQSLGEVMKRNGWKVLKNHVSFGEIALPASSPIMNRMGLFEPGTLGTHYYELNVANRSCEAQYVEILEIHHPEYLSMQDIVRIYFEGNSNRRDTMSHHQRIALDASTLLKSSQTSRQE